MTANEKFIEDVCKDLLHQEDMKMYINVSDIRWTLEKYLSDKVIIDKKVLDDMIEKYKEIDKN